MAIVKKEGMGQIRITYIDSKTREKITETIPIRIVHSKRKSMGLVVDENAEVILRLPTYVSNRRGMEFVTSKQSWIIEKVLSQREKALQRQLEKQNSHLSPEVEKGLKKRYVDAAREYLPKRCDYYADLLGVSYHKIRIAEQKTRWGSCSSKKTLSFNWRLMLAPPKVQDYVILHEVCHLREMNHSKAFWSLVEEQMPDYKEYRKWLKENGNTLHLS